jgi:hypothetical protein
LSISQLGEFLGLTPAAIRVALGGTRSILNVPENDNGAVVPYHASLGDFVKDNCRSKPLFCPLGEQHKIMLGYCMHHATTVMENPNLNSDRVQSKAKLYACWHWSSHLAAVLSGPHTLANDTSNNKHLQGFVLRVGQQGLRQWLYSLYDDSGKAVTIANMDNLCKAYVQLKVNLLWVTTLHV